MCEPWVPHAQTILNAAEAQREIASSFPGPFGSGTFLSALGSVLRQPNRLHTVKLPKPIARARRSHLPTDGSFRTSVAVEGFSMMKRIRFPPGCQIRVNS